MARSKEELRDTLNLEELSSTRALQVDTASASAEDSEELVSAGLAASVDLKDRQFPTTDVKTRDVAHDDRGKRKENVVELGVANPSPMGKLENIETPKSVEFADARHAFADSSEDLSKRKIEIEGENSGNAESNESSTVPNQLLPPSPIKVDTLATTVRLPRVTKTTRRETFATIGSTSTGRRAEDREAGILSGIERGSTRPPQIHSGGSSEDDMMDLFSPPPPSSSRSRTRNTLQSTVRTPFQKDSESYRKSEHSHHFKTDDSDRYFEYKEHEKRDHEQAQYHGMKSMVSQHPIAAPRGSSMPESRTIEDKYLHDDTAPSFSSITDDMNFETNEEMENALQLSFESSGSSEQSRGAHEEEHNTSKGRSRNTKSSPLDMQSFRSSPIVAPTHDMPSSQRESRRHESHSDRKPTTYQKARTPSAYERPLPPPSSAPPYQYPVYYPHHHGYPYGPSLPPPPGVTSPQGPGTGYHHHPSSATPPQMPPSHLVSGYPSPGYPPPPGYPQWSSPPPSGSHPGYYMYPPHPIGPPHHHYPISATESKSRTPAKKRDRRIDVESTKNTADLSFEEDYGGPATPPSTKKAKETSASAAWSSPSQGCDHDEMDTDITPQRGSAVPFRSKRDANARTPSGAVEKNLSFGGMPTPGRDILPSGSWSPMGALFDDDDMSTDRGENREDALVEGASFGRPALSDIGNQSHSEAPRRPNEISRAMTRSPTLAITSGISPARAGLTIQGSPISRKEERSGDRGITSGAHSEATPARRIGVRGSDKTPKERYHTPSNRTSGAFRIRIGNFGMETTEARRGMEGINSVLRGSPLSSQHRGNFPSPPHVPSAGSHHQSLHHYDVPPTTRQMSTPTHRFQVSHIPPEFQTPSARKVTGKENTENERNNINPCNCKKSKCLKLYCECFAAENYCDGCKCSNCQNIPVFEAIRQKAITDTRAKNPNAFKPRIASKPSVSGTPHSHTTAHATGCKCKKSACLKKYCECFEAGIVCSKICKCSDCQNFIGSQALIDRRRKIKDVKGAESAMRSSDEAWRGSMSDSKIRMYSRSSHMIAYQQSPVVHIPGSTGRIPSMMMMSPLPTFASPHMRHPYVPPHGMISHSPMTYPHSMITPYPSRMESTPGYSDHSARKIRGNTPPHANRSAARYSATRKGFRPLPDQEVASHQHGTKEIFFGPDVPKQSKATALSVFSFLSNDDLFNASIVSKAWSNLAFDQELWDSTSGGGQRHTA